MLFSLRGTARLLGGWNHVHNPTPYQPHARSAHYDKRRVVQWLRQVAEIKSPSEPFQYAYRPHTEKAEENTIAYGMEGVKPQASRLDDDKCPEG